MSQLAEQLTLVQQASRELINVSAEKMNEVLSDLAEYLLSKSDEMLAENQKDLDNMDADDPKYDRLKLTHERLEGIAGDMKNVAKLGSPLELTLEEKTLKNGLNLRKVTVPLGVIGIIYEARPNVTFDVFSLCFKSGNACVLKGGSDAYYSNLFGVQLIHTVLEKHGINKNVVHLLSTDRAETLEMLKADDYIDVVIPRGSANLINFVRENAKVPVIETGAGIVHTYFDAEADLEMGKNIINNAKTRRVSVCNALDTLVIHKDRLDDLADLVAPLAESNVEIFADDKAFERLKGSYNENLLHPATEDDFGREFLDYKMSIKTVGSEEEAVNHISKYSSKHSEAIITDDEKVAEYFLKNVDAAAVYVNTSTAFTDGAQFELGAEIGISTQKLHARGPMSLRELTSYKWLVKGDGQIRS